MATSSSNGSTERTSRFSIDPETRKQVNEAAESVRTAVSDVGHAVSNKGQSYLNQVLPAEKRDALVTRIQEFTSARPKLSAFVGVNLLLSGVPIALFTTFSVSVFFFSLLTTISVAVFTALTFTVFSIGTALLVLLPTLFFTTISATFLFAWGLSSYYVLRWILNRRQGQTTATEQNIREKLNRLTGGRLESLESSVKDESRGDNFDDQFSKAWTTSGSRSDGSALSGSQRDSKNGPGYDRSSNAVPRNAFGGEKPVAVIVPGAAPGKTSTVVVSS